MRWNEPWNEEENLVLIQLYSTTSNGEIAKRLNRTSDGVRGRARALSLTKRHLTKCDYCGITFEAKRSDDKFCSVGCAHKNYVAQHKEHYRELRTRGNHKLYAKLREFWGLGSVGSGQTEISRRAEYHVAEYVLPKEGFTSILLTHKIASMFPYIDVFARKKGEIYGVQVTLLPTKHVPSKVKPLMEFFGMRMLVCHVKPDFSWYHLNEIRIRDKTKHTSSSCIGAFFKFYYGKITLQTEAKALIHI